MHVSCRTLPLLVGLRYYRGVRSAWRAESTGWRPGDTYRGDYVSYFNKRVVPAEVTVTLVNSPYEYIAEFTVPPFLRCIGLYCSARE